MAALQTTKEAVQRSGEKTRKTLNQYGIAIPGWIQGLTWSAGVIVFFVLTTWSSVKLFRSYMNEDENVAIQTEILLNEKFAPPQLVLAIRHNQIVNNKENALGRISGHLYEGTEAQCVECQQLTRLSWDVWRHLHISNTSVTDVYYSLTAAYARKLLSNIDSDFDALSDVNSDWNAPVVDAAINIFIWLSEVDFKFKPSFDSSSGEIASVLFDYANTTSSTDQEHVYDLLHSRVMKAMCRRMTLHLTYPTAASEENRPLERHCEDLLINSSYPIGIGRVSFWVPIPCASGLKCRLTGSLLSLNDTSMWTPLAETGVKDITLFADPLSLYVSKIDSGYSYWWYSIGSGKISDIRSPYIGVQYSVTMRTKEERPDKMKHCHHEITPKICVEKCTKRWTIERCKCVPFSYHRGLQFGYIDDPLPYHRLPYCGEKAYTECNIPSFEHMAQDYCLKNCSNPCQHTSYNFVTYNEEQPGDGIRGFIVEVWLVASDSVVQFSNATKHGADEIIAQIGGVIGLYLGLTALSLLTCLINLIDLTQQYLRKRKDRRNRKKLFANVISLFKMAAMNRLIREASENNNDEDANDGDGQENCETSTQHDSDREEGILEQMIKMLKSEQERMKAELLTLQTQVQAQAAHEKVLSDKFERMNAHLKEMGQPPWQLSGNGISPRET